MDQNQPDIVILPENETDSSAPRDIAPAKQPKKPHSFTIVIVICLLIIAGAVTYIILNSNTTPTPEPEPNDKPTSFMYDADEFNANLDLAESSINIKDYVGANHYISRYSAIERMTNTQKYRYYSIYANLYSEEHLDNPELAEKYSGLAETALKAIRKGEE